MDGVEGVEGSSLSSSSCLSVDGVEGVEGVEGGAPPVCRGPRVALGGQARLPRRVPLRPADPDPD
eukprot:9475346-Pyramimonas_sp.AAC.1